MGGSRDDEVGLEQSVPDDAQAGKHGAAKHNVVLQRRSFDILDNVRLAGSDQNVPNRLNEPWPVIGITVPVSEVGIRLTRRGSVDRVKGSDEERVKPHRVGLNELEGKPGLRREINTHHLKPSATIPDRRPSRPAEKVEQSQPFRHGPTSPPRESPNLRSAGAGETWQSENRPSTP